jgi:hypothetical protein
VLDEPTVKMTFRGYAPVLPIKVMETDLNYLLYISAKSLSIELDVLRDLNGGAFTSLQFALRKQSKEQTSPYMVRSGESSG